MGDVPQRGACLLAARVFCLSAHRAIFDTNKASECREELLDTFGQTRNSLADPRGGSDKHLALGCAELISCATRACGVLEIALSGQPANSRQAGSQAGSQSVRQIGSPSWRLWVCSPMRGRQVSHINQIPSIVRDGAALTDRPNLLRPLAILRVEEQRADDIRRIDRHRVPCTTTGRGRRVDHLFGIDL